MNLFCLDEVTNIKRDYRIVLFQNALAICARFKTVYTVVKSVQEPSNIGEYPNLHNCRTAGFK